MCSATSHSATQGHELVRPRSGTKQEQTSVRRRSRGPSEDSERGGEGRNRKRREGEEGRRVAGAGTDIACAGSVVQPNLNPGAGTGVAGTRPESGVSRNEHSASADVKRKGPAGCRRRRAGAVQGGLREGRDAGSVNVGGDAAQTRRRRDGCDATHRRAQAPPWFAIRAGSERAAIESGPGFEGRRRSPMVSANAARGIEQRSGTLEVGAHRGGLYSGAVTFSTDGGGEQRSRHGVCQAVEHSSGLIQAVLCKTCVSEEAVGWQRNTAHLRASGQPAATHCARAKLLGKASSASPRDATRWRGLVWPKWESVPKMRPGPLRLGGPEWSADAMQHREKEDLLEDNETDVAASSGSRTLSCLVHE
ncbi:hypothetical protein B0H14DRAFT_3165972 [Mycena olivaceomarginata]|nr:hypothetical protein B0H14DRAFT_3165972 [Mycena olivaceomarginata]